MNAEAKPQEYEISEEVRKAVEDSFYELTGREIKEGNLAEQLRGLNLKPTDLTQEIIDLSAETLGIFCTARRIGTTSDLYAALQEAKDAQLTLEGVLDYAA